MVERLGEMRKGRRERIEKGSRERIIEKRERDKMREGGPERPPFYRIFYLRDPPFIEFSRSYKLELKHQNLVFTSL